MMVSASFDERRLLVLDLDGSLVGGKGNGLERLQDRLAAGRPSLVLVYVSGQSLHLQRRLIEQEGLLQPDYLISSVGTEIRRMPGEHPVDEWTRYIQVGFDREAVDGFIERERKNGRWVSLESQPPEEQSSLKLSYFWEDASPEEREQLQHQLLAAGFPAKVIYSRELYLDIVPELAGIGAAVKFLVDSLMLFPNQVFVSGDSGKDIDLFQYGFRGIVVGNATRELRVAVELRAYFSHGSFAEGVLEGLEYYQFFDQTPRRRRRDLPREALERALESLRRNVTPMGFSAASLADNPLTEKDSNYFAVWARDGIKTGLWSLCANDPEITECFRRTLELLARHQTESGQIPSNVRIGSGEPDYGGIGEIASIDSVIWFVIGSCRYAAYLGDKAFLRQILPHVELAMTWLRAHDSNNNGLLEFPESSDWMDLFPRSYNVLYGEVLWYQACLDYSVAAKILERDSRPYEQLAGQVRRKIVRQFWPTPEKISESRESFFEKQFTLGDAQYLLSQISPFDFSWRCDVYANLLASLVGLLDDGKLDQLFHFLWGAGINSPYPVKCLYPAVHSGASDWKDYFVTNFLNLPDHYHNGGIWPFIGGLWVRFLARTGRHELAHQELYSLADACRQGIYGQWEFNEWLHGQTGRPMGKAHQAWSAASYISAYSALHHDAVPPDFEPLREEMFEPVSRRADERK